MGGAMYFMSKENEQSSLLVLLKPTNLIIKPIIEGDQ